MPQSSKRKISPATRCGRTANAFARRGSDRCRFGSMTGGRPVFWSRHTGSRCRGEQSDRCRGSGLCRCNIRVLGIGGVKRSELWTVAGAADYAGKPRPAPILQDEFFDATDSVTICPTTTTDIGAAMFRVPIAPAPLNGLVRPCFLMADKVTTVSRRKMGKRLGLLTDDDMLRLGRAVATFLRLAG